MKTKHVVTAFLLLIGSLTAEVSAQTTLKALVKKCETSDAVHMSIVKRRNQKKEPTRTIISITIKNDETLVNQFIEAFRKDESEAIRVSESKQGGKTNNTFYRFEGGTTYNLNIEDKSNASVSVVERYGADDDDEASEFFNFDNTNFSGSFFYDTKSADNTTDDSER
ncbi:MAG: DUF5024 domain-containing protein [Tannerellaceae bacterium]|jgi:hypothetical protein|nr:DUF5024 domain-containing protein [Tannerellaceae bacterium]